MKSQAMAIITLHKLVAASVEDFRKRFPDWSTTVSSALKKKKKKRKLNVETVSGASKKTKNNLSVSDSEGEDNEKSDSEGEDSEKSDSENDDRSSASNSDNEEESVISKSDNEEENGSERDSEESCVSNEEEDSEKEEEDESDREEDTENNLGSEDGNNELVSSNEEFQNDSEDDIKKPIVKNTAVKSLKRHLEQPNSQPPNKKPTLTISQKKSNKVVKKNDEDKEGSKHPLKKTVKPRAVKEKPKVVDPFFMTTTNEEYLTSQAPTVGDDKDSNWKIKSDDFGQTRYNSFSNLNSRNQRSSREGDWKQNKFSNRESQQHQKPFVLRSEKTSSNNGVEPFNIFTNRKERRKALQQPAQEEKVEKLHPSWEAKKKQTSIASFQGKKITFD